jgi:hypothetical protein
VDFQNYQKAYDAGFLASIRMPQDESANRFSDWRAIALMMRVEDSRAAEPCEDRRMNETIPVRARPANAVVLAFLTVLALAIASVCAPLCAAKSCASGLRQEQCHDIATMGPDGRPQLVAPSMVCGLSDFSAVLVKADEENLLSQGARNHAAPVILNGSPELGLESLRTGPQRRGVYLILLDLPDSLLLTTILRI